ncbi:MAG: hypothetical protein AAFN70_02790, partial [Planctomycetota bacterium]
AGLFEENEEVVVQQLQRVLGPIRWQDDAADSYTVPLSAYAIVSVPPLRITSDSGALQQLNRDLISADLVDRVVDAKLAFLDGKSLRDAASDPQLDLARTGLVRMLESATEWQGTPDNWLEKVREIANVSAQDPIRPTTGEQAELLRNDQLPLVDVSNLVMTDMMFMMSRAARVGCIQLATDAANKILAHEPNQADRDAIREDLEGDADDAAIEQQINGVRLAARNTLIQTAQDPNERLSLIDVAIEDAKSANTPWWSFALAKITTLIQLGEVESAQAMLNEYQTSFGTDQQAMMALQQMLVEMGILNPDGSPRMMPPGAAGGPGGPAASPGPAPAGGGGGGGGGIWTPDNPSGGGPSGGDAGGSSGESKIWMPGMD